MPYEVLLSFMLTFLEKIHLECSLVTRDIQPFPVLDLGLRSLLKLEKDYEISFDFLEKNIQPNIIYKMSDPFFCHYVFLLLPDTPQTTILAIGPYTNANVSDQTVMNLVETSSIPASLTPQMLKYYSRVPILWDDSALFAALEAFGQKIWGGPDQFAVQCVETRRSGFISPIVNRYSTLYSDTSINMEVLEARYRMENQLLRAVSLGQTHRAEELVDPFPWGPIEPRSSDSIRNVKNYMIIMNSLMRKAAEQGYVHPIHIDRLSGYFARKIELISHPNDVSQLTREMAYKYCLLVKNHSLKAYSLPIQKVITNIDFDLTADLSLKAQASLLNVNPSYLSTLFKKETGSTLTDYVNQKRVGHAILLLNSTTLQVQAIAQQCGIPDVNYFSKTFKKIVGKTPMEYRKSITHPSLP
ncbi:MAG: AraC family transcriptional regulator [Eubacteriales bacterium]|nr:AraC family transcriptional regulator [Eubacteriales bacterium]